MAAPRTTLPDLLTGPIGLIVAAVLDDRADLDEQAASDAGTSRVQAATITMLRRAAHSVRALAESDGA